jgi:SAM-dependent methyltransferase
MATTAFAPFGGDASADLESDERLRHLLDRTVTQLSAGDTRDLDDFVVALNAARLERLPSEWNSLIASVIAPHCIRGLMHQEPFTRHAFAKPRGYPGDAALLDLIYRDTPFDGEMTPLGERLHAWTATGPACLSVRERRNILAALIDRVTAERPNPRVLSIACGHLREAQQSEAVRAGAVQEIVAVDQDERSLELVRHEQAANRVSTVRASIRRVLVDPTVYGTFDLVYAAGLYDYLEDAVAARLTSCLFSALRPGGTLLVANFAPNLRDIGYMEAIMEWRLIYRDEAEVARFTANLPPALVREQTIARDRHGNVVYLTVRKC